MIRALASVRFIGLVKGFWMTLPANCTLLDLRNGGFLHKPEEFLRKIAINLRQREAALDQRCWVRIGLSGSGQFPNYRIEPTVKNADPSWDELGARNTAFSGKSHKVEMSGLQSETWSTMCMTSDTIELLRRAIISEKRPSSRFALSENAASRLRERSNLPRRAHRP